MSLLIDRRSLVRGGALGLGALLLPGGAQALAQLAAARGFTHSVASGEPQPESVLLWTRFVGAGDGGARVRAEVSETADFARVVAGGEAVTGPWRDWTVKLVATGLAPGRPYFYRFVADGQTSPVGRTKTLPAGRTRAARFAVFSCSNLPFGWFNAYGHAAARDDLDFALHLGDYLYEYARGSYPSAREAVPGRLLEPVGEMIQLADYRTRYACYRADPDLQALHARMPVIASWDDHESANDSWEGGAENHTPGSEGEWSVRKAAAMQAWREWMPVSDAPWGAYQLGDLATLFRTETRLLGRSEPPSLVPIFAAGGDLKSALTDFRDGAWQDPARTMLGFEQEAWIAAAIRRSVAAGTRWQIAGFGTIMGNTSTPAVVADWVPQDAPELVRNRVRAGLVAAGVGLPFNLDNWGGYPAARARFLKAAQAADANLIVLAGDSHNGWAFDLVEDGRPAGVEFDTHSVTSPGFENYFRTIDPRRTARALVERNPELKWADTSNRGYMVIGLTPDAATAEWHFLATIRERSSRLSGTHRLRVGAGRRMLAAA
jgi:alkaline phosphatase D